MEYINDLYDILKTRRVDTDVVLVKMRIGEAILEAETLLIEYQKRKNELKNAIDEHVLIIQAYEREILQMEEDMKWANEVVYTLREWVSEENNNG